MAELIVRLVLTSLANEAGKMPVIKPSGNFLDANFIPSKLGIGLKF